MNDKIVVAVNKEKIESYRQLCETNEYDSDVKITASTIRMLHSKICETAGIVLFCIDKKLDWFQYAHLCSKMKNKKVILIVKNKVPFMDLLRLLYKCKIIYSNDDQIRVVENILDAIAYRKTMKVTYKDLLEVCSLGIVRCECYVGSKEYLFVKAATNWNKKKIEKCCVLSLYGDFDFRFTTELTDMLPLADDVKFDFRGRENETVRGFILWRKKFYLHHVD